MHRSYALDPTAYDALKEHVIAWDKERYILDQDTQKLFVWSNGEQVDTRATRSMFGQHCEAAGVPIVALQEIRQAYIVAAVETGIPVRVIAQRLGHTVEPRNLRAVPRNEHAVPRDANRQTRGRSRSCRSKSF
jgi:site-specific recombinase XerD